MEDYPADPKAWIVCPSFSLKQRGREQGLKWFIIDWDDAAVSPTKALTRFDNSSKVLVMDMVQKWIFGKYIEQDRTRC